MSKKRRRHRRERQDIADVQGELNNNLPFGINPNQLLSLLGENFDLNNLGNVMSSMKNNGVDLNSFNSNSSGSNQQGNSNENNIGGYEFGGLQGLMNALGMNSFNQQNNGSTNFNSNFNNNFNENDDNIDGITDTDEESGLKEGIEEDYSGKGIEEDDDIIEEDENIQMLISIKSIVDDRKAEFIDKIMDAYRKGLF